jgi:hypothetical protein
VASIGHAAASAAEEAEHAWFPTTCVANAAAYSAAYALCPIAGYAAQSLLAAIGCVQFVSNVLFASFVLKEKVGLGSGSSSRSSTC